MWQLAGLNSTSLDPLDSSATVVTVVTGASAASAAGAAGAGAAATGTSSATARALGVPERSGLDGASEEHTEH